jgi:hypothetical protein
VGGSVATDNLTIYRTDEAKWSRAQKISYYRTHKSKYERTNINFTHWKWLRDTKEQFFSRWLNVYFQNWTREERLKKAQEQWDIKGGRQYEYSGNIPEVLLKYRDLLAPLGGFDIVDYGKGVR